MDLEVRHLRLVHAVAEEGAMIRAARRLHLTQSALSHQLRVAEERVGKPLFLRLPRRMLLTPAGERVLRAARLVLAELDQAADEIERGAREGRAVLRLATQCYTVYHWLPARLRQFQTRWPRADVQVVAEATPHPYAALFEGKLDLAIVSHPIRDHRVRYKPLFVDELVAVVPPAHRLAGRTHVELQDFADENLFIYPPREESSFLVRVLGPAGVTPRSIQEMQLTEAILELVKGGFGTAVLARWAVAPQIAAGSLRGLRVTRRGLRREWSAATLRARAPEPHLEAFVRLLQESPLSPPRRAQPVA